MRDSRLSCSVPSFAAVLLVTAVALVGFARPAYAYVDPSVVTYTIQALAAVAVALSAVAGVAFRRSRGVIFRLLGIDEDAGKTLEPPVSVIAPYQKAAADAFAIEDMEAAEEAAAAPPLRWPSRFWRAFIAAEALAFTLLIVAPLELVAGNQTWLLFTLDDAALPIAVAGFGVGFVLALVLSLFRGKAFSVALCVTGALAVCCYVQALLLNGPLPIADGTEVIWDDYTKITLLSGAVWLAILLVPAILACFHQRTARFITLAACVALTIIQGVGVWSLWSMPLDASDAPIMVSQEGLFDVSEDNNVVVIILDAADTRWFNQACEADPTIYDTLTGFTYFYNAVGCYSPTRYAIPYLLTAQRMQVTDEYAEDYIARRYEDGTFLEDLDATGANIGIYSDSAVYHDAEREILATYADNVTRTQGANSSYLDPIGTVKVLWKTAFYRDMTWLLKPPFWYVGDQINMGMLDSSQVGRLGAERSPYIIDDVRYYGLLTENKLQYNDESGSLRFIHLMGSHSPWDMTRDVKRVAAGESTVVEQTVGAFNIVREYINQLKAIGAYENTTIIITADHGKLYTNLDTLWEETNALILVKPGNQTAEEAAAPLALSNVPVSHLDFHPTVLAALGADEATIAKYEGVPIFSVTGDAARTRYYYMASYDATGSSDYFLREYVVGGDAHDFGQWQETGNIWYFLNERSGHDNTTK